MIKKGGWGANGQPNDAWHQFLRLLQKIAARLRVSWQRNILLREKLEELEIDINGLHTVSAKLEDAIRDDCWCRAVLDTVGRKIIRWAWISRGYTTIEEMATWPRMPSLEELQQEQTTSAKGMFTEFLRLEQVPELKLPKKVPLPSAGETEIIWQVSPMV